MRYFCNMQKLNSTINGLVKGKNATELVEDLKSKCKYNFDLTIDDYMSGFALHFQMYKGFNLRCDSPGIS